MSAAGRARGAPGIGKPSLVRNFAESLGLVGVPHVFNFPPGAPALVVTDGWCDVLRVRREHAYLIPQSRRLPFTPRGPVFQVQ